MSQGPKVGESTGAQAATTSCTHQTATGSSLSVELREIDVRWLAPWRE
jgi:hypothetical protein